MLASRFGELAVTAAGYAALGFPAEWVTTEGELAELETYLTTNTTTQRNAR